MNKELQEQRKIINSKPFRRLADKTQVIPSIDRNAQIRTRLTHSLEVASISKEITYKIKKILNYTLNPDTIYNVSLLHDLGMAPLGHLGEDTLNEIAHSLFGLHFEANANNIAVILEKLDDISPLTIVSTIKYPYLIKENERGKGLYEAQYNTYIPILTDTIKIQNQIPEIKRERTYECDIMEISDDLAYLFSDLEDYISLTKTEERIKKKELSELFERFGLNNPNLFFAMLDGIENANLKSIEKLRNEIIDEVSFIEEENAIGIKDQDHLKLLKIVRYIDWHYYIQKFSLTGESELIKDYNNMLRFVFSNLRDRDIVEKFIYSKTKLKEYRRKLAEEDSRDEDVAKVLVASMSELSDTFAIRLIDLYRKEYSSEEE